MKEYGGYIEFEHYWGKEYHQGLMALNCGRNCLAHLITAKCISKIYLPYFLCDSISKICSARKSDIVYYHIDKTFCPICDFELKENEYLYVVNFYGQLEKAYLLTLKKKYKNIIVDNVQAFFEKPLEDIDTIYVPRKYFGVADGAYLSTNCQSEADYIGDQSHNRMHFLLGRFEGGASQYYTEYQKNNKNFENEPIKAMSELTHNLLRGIDYEMAKKKREDNFTYLYNEFQDNNLLDIKCVEGPFAYPLLIRNGYILRNRLKKVKIYIPTLWPNVLEDCKHESLEYQYARDILPIPVDQRYTIDDMKYIAGKIRELMRY